MANSNHSSSACVLPSELTPKQLDSLPFVPSALTNFDEKDKLPPTARAQWAYVQLNPVDYLTRFTEELDLHDAQVAICFINKEAYEDSEKDLRTPITVNLIVHPDLVDNVSAHLKGKDLSHQILEDNKGFTLPYLGSIQKTVDALSLEKLVSFMFIKNSISREAYSTWISVPKSLLDKKKKKKAAKKAPPPVEKTPAASQSAARKENAPKEDFNYVVYDDQGETAPPIIPTPEDPKPKTVVVKQPPVEKKPSAFSKLAKRLASKKKAKTPKQKKVDNEPACPVAKFDASLFAFLALFNFYSTVLLLNFLGSSIEAIGSVMVEASTLAALISLLFTIFVIRPSFRLKKSRMWSLCSYVAVFAVAGFQIVQSSGFTGTANYLVPGVLSFACLMGAIVSAFMRIDRISARKPKAENTEEAAEQPTEDPATAPKPVQVPDLPKTTAKRPAAKPVNLPPPIKTKAKKKETKKIELKPAPKTTPPPQPEEADEEIAPDPVPEVAAREEPAKKTVKLPSQRSIPNTPITEEQKEAIRSRLTRRETLSTPSTSAPENNAEDAPEAASESQKPLSTAEIKARLAERLQKARATNSGLNAIGKPKEEAKAEDVADTAEETTELPSSKRSIQLRKPATKQTKQRNNKLSLPNS